MEKITINEKDYLHEVLQDGSIVLIPCDLANSDYQRYLNPAAEQSTPIVTSDE